jgi:large repetitive protein
MIKHYSMLFLLLMSYFNLFSQNVEPFAPARYNDHVKGDVLLIGNNILSVHPMDSYNTTGNPSSFNDDINMVYVDIDGDASTFSSSSANLQIPITSRDCYRVKYAALYWSATYKSGDRTNLNKIKFKTPGSSIYTDITGSIIYDEGDGNQFATSCKPYVAFADVTSLLSLSSAEGYYTVANITASLGSGNTTNGCPGGNAGGWSLFVVFEDPKLTSKFITTFDGFTGINGTNTQTIPISGFKTNPTGSVYAKLAFSALEGDNRITGDGMQIRGVNTTPTFSDVTSLSRPITNFFNSSFSDVNGGYVNRIPASQNTLGYDAGVTNVVNPAQSVLGNNETQAEVKLSSTGDQYYLFFLAFSVESIEPNVILTKTVENNAGQDIGSQDISLCQEINYRIGFDNIGNDDAEGLPTQPAPYGSDYVIIKDVLPQNVTMLDFDITDVPGTIGVYDPNSKNIIFYVPKRFFTVAESRHYILIKVKTACSCLELVDACSNVIKNQAFISYQAVRSGITVINDPSLSQYESTCSTGVVSSTNFLVDTTNCVFTTEAYIHEGTATLKAGIGYDSYIWSGPVGAVLTPNNTSQSINVNLPGVYTVIGTSTNCGSITQAFHVVETVNSISNPIIPYDESPIPVVCTDNNERIPTIYLCGETDNQLLSTNMSDAISVQWFLYDEACEAYPASNCPIVTESCWSNLVGEGSDYTVSQTGKYKVVFNFTGEDARTFYFNVYKNTMNPSVIAEDIVCGNSGRIIVANVPSTGYQFQLLNSTNNQIIFPWQSSNIFTPINTAGNYTVQVRSTSFSGGCVFSVSNIGIQVQDLTVTDHVTQPLCYGQFGEVNLGVTGVRGQYYFNLYHGFTVTSPLLVSVGPTNLTYYVFRNLNPGQTYTWQIITDDGCYSVGTFTLNNPTQLNVNSIANDSEITVNTSGGTQPYQYSLDGVTYTSSNIFSGVQPGNYTIFVRDNNWCLVSSNQILNPIAPVIDNPTQTFPVGATLADIQVEGQNIRWYAAQSGYRMASSELPLSTVLVDGTTYYVSQTVNGIESQKTPITVKVGTLSNDDFSFQNLKVYPIPAKEILTVANTSIINKVAVFNYLGAEVLSESVDKSNFEINLSKFAKGVYFVRVESQDSQKTIKFIKE